MSHKYELTFRHEQSTSVIFLSHQLWRQCTSLVWRAVTSSPLIRSSASCRICQVTACTASRLLHDHLDGNGTTMQWPRQTKCKTYRFALLSEWQHCHLEGARVLRAACIRKLSPIIRRWFASNPWIFCTNIAACLNPKRVRNYCPESNSGVTFN